jgi:hypothetical protein
MYTPTRLRSTEKGMGGNINGTEWNGMARHGTARARRPRDTYTRISRARDMVYGYLNHTPLHGAYQVDRRGGWVRRPDLTRVFSIYYSCYHLELWSLLMFVIYLQSGMVVVRLLSRHGRRTLPSGSLFFCDTQPRLERSGLRYSVCAQRRLDREGQDCISRWCMEHICIADGS